MIIGKHSFYELRGKMKTHLSRGIHNHDCLVANEHGIRRARMNGSHGPVMVHGRP